MYKYWQRVDGGEIRAKVGGGGGEFFFGGGEKERYSEQGGCGSDGGREGEEK